jgi:hypothetical protein
MILTLGPAARTSSDMSNLASFSRNFFAGYRAEVALVFIFQLPPNVGVRIQDDIGGEAYRGYLNCSRCFAM